MNKIIRENGSSKYIDELQEAAKPLLVLLDKKYSPHTQVIINSRSVEVVESKILLGHGICDKLVKG